MNRPLLLALTAPLCLFAQNPEPRVETKAPEFRQSQPGPHTLREAVDALPEADLKEFLTILRDHYIAPEKLDEPTILRATVQGLIERFAPGVILPIDTGAAAKASPFRSEIIENRVGYIRLGALGEATLSDLDGALKGFREHYLQAAVLDLRAVPEGSEFELAAKICERFCPKGRVLFTVRKPSAQQELMLTSKQAPTFSGVLVTLTDSDTAGAAEVIAAVLRTQAKALVIGQATRGEAVEYAEVPLPSGRTIRIAVAEVALPDKVHVFPGGVAPDVAVEVTADETERVLAAALDGGVVPLINETERPRLNEAALVAGQNPELDAMRHRQGKLPVPVLRDVVLQRALDAITTIALFEKPGKK